MTFGRSLTWCLTSNNIPHPLGVITLKSRFAPIVSHIADVTMLYIGF